MLWLLVASCGWYTPSWPRLCVLTSAATPSGNTQRPSVGRVWQWSPWMKPGPLFVWNAYEIQTLKVNPGWGALAHLSARCHFWRGAFSGFRRPALDRYWSVGDEHLSPDAETRLLDHPILGWAAQNVQLEAQHRHRFRRIPGLLAYSPKS